MLTIGLKAQFFGKSHWDKSLTKACASADLARYKD